VIKLSKSIIVEEYNMMNRHSLSIITYMYKYLYKDSKRRSNVIDTIQHDIIFDLINKNIRTARVSTTSLLISMYPFKRYVIEESKDNLSEVLMGY